MQRASGAQQRHQPIDDLGPDQPTAALAAFRPRIGEEHPDRRQGPLGNARQEIDDVAFDDSNVAQPAALHCLEHRGHAWGVHVDAEDALVRTQLGDLDQRLAGAESDVENDLADVPAGITEHPVAEHDVERQWVTCDADSPRGHRPRVCVISRRRQAAATRLERPLRWVHRARRYRHGTMMVTPANVQG